ncbi:MAG: hypothetical protein RR512_06205, partial [Coprobacillus sp.]
EGKAIGKEEGLIEGKLNAMKIAIKEIYHRDDIDWLNQLTSTQLEEGFQLVFKGLKYEDLKKEIIEKVIAINNYH